MIDLATVSASELHRSRIGVPLAAASAPGSWNLIGEATGNLGGVTITGNTDYRAEVAYSPRSDSTIAVNWCERFPTPSLSYSEISTEDVAQAAAVSDGTETPAQYPDTTSMTPAHRLGAVAWNLVYSQSVRGMAHGIDITVVNSIPSGVGLGEMTAVESAFALALSADVPEVDTPPERLRLSDACSKASTLFLERPPVSSRYATNLRAVNPNPSLFDGRENAIFEVPRVSGSDYRLCVIAKPGSRGSQQCQDRQGDILNLAAKAAAAFQVATLRDLPNATERIVQWLDAHHSLGLDNHFPSGDTARKWLDFYFSELERTTTLGSTIRAHHMKETATILNQSQRDLLSIFTPGDDVAALTELVLDRGALSARCASEDLRASVIALVPAHSWDSLRADILDDGLTIVEIRPGEGAHFIPTQQESK